ncbi:MAG: protein translocase subunit SecF [Burkholderiales bacterium]|nr:MAG: protein translocase subunit SecF [Burkholderiales bacterium]
MELFRIKRDIPFMRYALILNAISFATFALAVIFLATRGLNLSIEFTGGILVEARYQESARLDEIRQALERAGVAEPQVQNFGTSRDVMLRLAVKDLDTPSISSVDANGKRELDRDKLLATVLSAGGSGAEITRVEFVGPQVGSELAEDGALALLLVIIGIMIYLAIRFEWKFSIAAIVANLHDVVIILGFFAFFQWEFSLAVLAATLAVLGYSVNESVVIFDRIRENFRKMRRATTIEVIDNAITRTMSRTVMTHGSTQIMVLSMLIFGGPTLHYFALALTIGILFGIYSSIFVGAAIAMWLGVKREDLVKPVKKKDDAEPELP